MAAHPQLHILVNNAGIWSPVRRTNADGVELTWATNMLGYFLGTELLLERLRASAPARIVVVASELAYGLDLDDVGFERRRYSGVAAYAQSKQANRMFTWALARRLEGSGVTANAVHPGGVATGIFRKGGGIGGRLVDLGSRLFARSPARGADTAIWLASSPEVEGRSGRFFADRRERRCPFHGEAFEEQLWARCAAATRPSTQ
jgi:NAD(P)-dependent dehydrogenase (short-subunit alcohol dehydrogenase family)